MIVATVLKSVVSAEGKVESLAGLSNKRLNLTIASGTHRADARLAPATLVGEANVKHSLPFD